jgi:large subunit ribosomal protein L14
MIQLNSTLSVIDNSGAKLVKCIKILQGASVAKLGDEIIVAVQKAAPNKKIKKGEVGKSLIVRVKKELKRKDGSTLNFSENAVIMLNKKNMPQGSRILGLVPLELRQRKNMKIISIAQGVI